MSLTLSYQRRLGAIETYFDRTAVDAWARLTSDAPVGRIRATVRAGRNEMRDCLLSWLPADLTGARVLDAGCGTGALAIEAARRGADVVAVDIAPNLIRLAQERAPRDLNNGSVTFIAGDMLDPALGHFDHIVSMDALIHYSAGDAVKVLGDLGQRTRGSMLATFAPRTPALALMHRLGRLFPRADRSPSIEPVSLQHLIADISRDPMLSDWQVGRCERVSRGFYISQALELVRP
jgi:magnesium-protoporphyrin O-methyltransferase